MSDRDELLNLIKCAIEFCNLAAGEGISIDNLSPEDFLFDYSGATGYEDWCTISDYVIDQIMRDSRKIERLTAENQRLHGALEQIAIQKRTDELVTAYDVEFADFEDGYDRCIDCARAALTEPKEANYD